MSWMIWLTKDKKHVHFENGVGRPKTAKPLMKHGQIGYVWSAISKTVFKIFLDQKSRKIWNFQYLSAEMACDGQKRQNL